MAVRAGIESILVPMIALVLPRPNDPPGVII
jgi:hypothetical protein